MLARNTAANTLAMVSGYVLAFLIAPVMLARLGTAQFGVWGVTGAFALYAGLIDLGITRALGRFIALYHARGERPVVEQLRTLGLIGVVGTGLVAGLAAVLAAPLVAALPENPLSVGEMRIIMGCAAVMAALNAARFVIKSVPEGMERFVEPAWGEFAFVVVSFVMSLAALLISTELVTYAVVNVFACLLGVGFALIAQRRVTGRLALRTPPRQLVREVITFGFQSQVSWLADLSVAQAAKIVLAVAIDVRAAAAFEIAGRAVMAVKAVASMSISAMVPTATALIANEGTKVIGDFYRRYTRLSLAISLPLMLLMSAAAPATLVAWLGDVPPGATETFVVLTLANCFNLSTGVSFAISLAEGRARAIAWVSAASAVVMIAVMIALVGPFGLNGVVWGTAAGVVGSAAVWTLYFHRSRHIPLWDYVRAVTGPFAVAIVAAIPIAASWLVFGTPSGRLEAFAVAVIDTVVYIAIYWPLADRLDLLPQKLRLGNLLRRRQPA